VIAIKELEKLGGEMEPRSPELAEHIRSIVTRIRAEVRERERAAFVLGKVGDCQCGICRENREVAEAEALRRFPKE
jgi:hypothetical protein